MIDDSEQFKMVYKDIKKEGIKVFWAKSEDGTDHDHEDSKRYKYNDLSRKFPWEVKSKNSNFSFPNYIGPPISILSSNEIEISQTLCFYCGEAITTIDCAKFDGNKCFCNDICWKDRIEKMIKSENYRIDELYSFAAKRYFLNCISMTYNGQLITKLLIKLKGFINQLEFSIILYENKLLYDHYVEFLRETHQNDELLLWCENKFQEHLRRFRKIMLYFIDVDVDTVEQFKKALVKFLNEIKPDVDMTYMPITMIQEYLSLLNWQTDTNENLINCALIETVIKTKASHLALHNNEIAMFLRDTFYMTTSEFIWTSLRPIVEEGNFAEVKVVLGIKGFHGKSLVTYERIVAFLVSLDKAPDDFKMKCLLKIPSITSLIECANLYGLLDYLIEFCKTNKEKKWKKLKNGLANYKR